MRSYLDSTTLICSIALAVLGFSVYSVNLHNQFVLDDSYLISNNPSIQSISKAHTEEWFTKSFYYGSNHETKSNYYRPLVLAVFALTYLFAGSDPFWYHMVSNTLHVLNALLVFFLIRYVFKKRGVAFITALIFVVHPVQSEGVSFISSQGDLLSSFFILLGLCAWLIGINERRKLLVYGVSTVCLLCALLSRENAVVFPLLAITLYVSAFTTQKFWKSIGCALKYLWPHFILVLCYVAVRLTVLNFNSFVNFGQVDATSPYSHLTVRLFTFMPVLREYAQMLVWPTNVHERFFFPVARTFFEIQVWSVAVVIVALGALLVWLYKKRRTQDFKLWFFASMWFFIVLVPSSGIVALPQIIQDHRLYLALIGPSCLAVAYLFRWIEYERQKGLEWVQYSVFAFLLVYFAFFASITLRQATIWGKPDVLLGQSIRSGDGTPFVYNSRGLYYMQIGEYQKAEADFIDATKLSEVYALPYFNLGQLYNYWLVPRDVKRAIYYYQKALLIDPSFKNAQEKLNDLNANSL